MQEGTLPVTLGVEKKPLSFILNVLQLFGDSWGPLVGCQGLPVEYSEAATSFVGPGSLCVPGSVVLYGGEDSRFVSTTVCFTQSQDLL